MLEVTGDLRRVSAEFETPGIKGTHGWVSIDILDQHYVDILDNTSLTPRLILGLH